jgi:hypothetical protein
MLVMYKYEALGGGGIIPAGEHQSTWKNLSQCYYNVHKNLLLDSECHNIK